MFNIIAKWKITWWYDQDLPSEIFFNVHANNLIDAMDWFAKVNHGLNHVTKVEFELVNEDKQEHPLNKPRIPEFIEILEASKAIHLRKNQDYANDNNPFANFERSATLIGWFNNDIDKAFIALIGTKLARIAELSDGRKPNNESLDDSFLDLVTYCGLWAAYSKRQRNNKIVICPNCDHQGLHHNDDGCTFCDCKVKGKELYPGNLIPINK